MEYDFRIFQIPDPIKSVLGPGDVFCSFCWEHLFYIFKKNQNVESDFQIFQIPDPRKSVLGPGDVFPCFVGPKMYRVVYHMENVPQTLSDTLYKFFL